MIRRYLAPPAQKRWDALSLRKKAEILAMFALSLPVFLFWDLRDKYWPW